MSARRSADAGGFVLVGVVMLILALTILGLSLYSLSSYEASFMGQSHDQNASTYRAQGGMDMVLALLAQGDSLQQAKGAQGFEGVTYTVAMQHRAFPAGAFDSTGAIDPDSAVFVTVIAEQRGKASMLTARYQPQNLENYYRRLFTCGGDIVADATAPPGNPWPDRSNTLRLTGDVWRQGNEVNWVPAQVQITGTRIHRAVPLPDVTGFIADHAPGTTVSTYLQNGYYNVDFFAPPGVPTFFTVDSPEDNSPDYDFETGMELSVHVSGTCIWMIPAGANLKQQFELNQVGTPRLSEDCLVIVAAPKGNNHAIQIEGGVKDANGLPVIMVSSGNVTIGADGGFVQNDNYLDRLSVYAKEIEVMGPNRAGPGNVPPFPVFRMSYDPVLMDPLIGSIGGTCLPRPVGAANQKFTLVRGSWRDLTP